MVWAIWATAFAAAVSLAVWAVAARRLPRWVAGGGDGGEGAVIFWLGLVFFGMAATGAHLTAGAESAAGAGRGLGVWAALWGGGLGVSAALDKLLSNRSGSDGHVRASSGV